MSVSEETQSAEEEFVDELRPGTRLMLGQYTIDRFLAAGGFGITYLATDSLERPIVIKECFPGSFCRRQNHSVMPRSRAHQEELKSIVQHFSQEAVTLSKAGHPNIVGVHQVFEENNTAYMALDYVEGRDLLETLKEAPQTLTPERVERYLNRMLDAIGHVHGRGLLHRDISPDNIIINQDDEPVLIDFGAARETADKKASRLLSALRVVKDGYSPQEFYIAGSQQTASCDLYSLAASFYHLITGELPPDSQSRLTAFAAGEPDPYVPLAKRDKGFSQNFATALDKAMSILPKERMQTAEEWKEHIEDGPSTASNTSHAATSQKVAATGSSSKLLLLGGTALATAAGAGFIYFATQSSDTFKSADQPTQSASVTSGATEEAEETALATDTADAKAVETEEVADALLAPENAEETEIAATEEAPAAPDASPEAEIDLAAPVAPEDETAATTDTASLVAPRAEDAPEAPVAFEDDDVAPQVTEAINVPQVPDVPVVSTEDPAIAGVEADEGNEPAILITSLQKPKPRPVRTAALAPTVETSPASFESAPEPASVADEPRIADVQPDTSLTGGADTVNTDVATIEAASVMEMDVPNIPFELSETTPGVVESAAADAPFWLTDGVRIVSVDGQATSDNAEILAIIRQAARNAGGETTVTIGMDALLSNAAIERRLPIISERQTALLNGLVFVSREEDDAIVTRVTQAPEGSTFRVGDKVVAFMATGERLNASTTLKSILDRELAAGETRFSFAVEREGEMWVEGFTLAALAE